MTKTVFRYDRAGTLRRPERTPEGFLKVEGHVARAGIYEYRRADGTIRRELRPPEEVGDPASLASYDAASLTVGHPRRAEGRLDDITAENVRRHEVGTVRGAARFDAERELVDAAMVFKDAAAIKQVEAGKQELSPGYRIVLDETPGVHPKYGRYDAIQRQIRVNHVALVELARGGSAIRLRMDDAELVTPDHEMRADGFGRLTSVIDGHQHVIDLDPSCGPFGGPVSMNSGSTTWAVSEGASSGHTHDWLRNPDGSITIAVTEGHTHTILDENHLASASSGVRADGQIDRPAHVREPGLMATTNPSAGSAPPPDAAEQIRLLTVRADEADRAVTEQRTRADSAERAADGARAELTTIKERMKVLEAQIAAGASAVETAAVIEQRRRADEAERELVRVRAQQPELIRRRSGLIARAAAVLGPTFRADDLDEREIVVAAVRHLRPKEDTSDKVRTDFLVSRLDALIEDRTNYSASLGRASEALTVRNDGGASSRSQPAQPQQKAAAWNDQWKQGAGRYATRKDV